MSNRIIDINERFPVQPQHIDASKHFASAFDHMETEISAGWIVRLLQDRGQGWAPFTFEEINAFYSRWQKDGFIFNRLVDPQMVPERLALAFTEGILALRIPVGGGWIVPGEDKKYYITVEFVTRCFKSSPMEMVTL